MKKHLLLLFPNLYWKKVVRVALGEPHNTGLKKALGTWQLWGIAVGLVISGEYFGWSYGWHTAGTLGFLVTTIAVASMYGTFIFSFTELTTSFPQAGGPFVYAYHAFGPSIGYLAGAATLIEFTFAPPAIALAIGSYLHMQFNILDPRTAALGAYLVFMTLNILGVQIAAAFELLMTLLAIMELIVFMLVVSRGFSIQHFVTGGWAGRNQFSLDATSGIIAAIPFAIWFFLAIEGVAMAAEEAENPRRSIPVAYITGICTLVILALGVMLFAGGAGDWTKLANINDPLPQAMRALVGAQSKWLHMLVWLGLFGLVASFHGIILGYSRQMFALARAGYLPRFLAHVNPRFKTPDRAVLCGGVVGIAAIYSDRWITFGNQPLTASIVTLSVLGALLMYIVSMLALFRIRSKHPDRARTYEAPFFPYFPAFALFASTICMCCMLDNNPQISFVFVILLVMGYIYFLLTSGQRKEADCRFLRETSIRSPSPSRD